MRMYQYQSRNSNANVSFDDNESFNEKEFIKKLEGNNSKLDRTIIS